MFLLCSFLERILSVRVELVFGSQSEQQRAKQLLEQQGYDSAALTLEFYSNAPAWISRLGADPIKLGLDLRGGAVMVYAGGAPVTIGTVPTVETGSERGLLGITADPAF